MPGTIHEVLDELRASALDERDKGDKFERLMQAYFRTDPEWSRQFEDVWLWSEWPGRNGQPDTGIDLVARERDGEGLTAIQCKFYAPDTYIQKSHIDSFFTASGKTGFDRRIVVSTSSNWSKNAEEALKDQQISTQRIDISYLSDSVIDWDGFSWRTPSVVATHDRKRLMPHQRKALEAVREGFAAADRGKLIMACGTGKTFTSLRIAEELVGIGGTVLFLVPSISLLSQTLREWMQEASVPLRPLAVCSDVKVGRREHEDMSVVDLAEPATTDAVKLQERMARSGGWSVPDRMTVVFSTYQSIQAVADAQALGLGVLDLVVCDEAHRTTGVTVAGEDESAFVRVHDQGFLKARKRLYMTATPRLYDDGSKTKAAEGGAVLASMDDESLYGPELHRLGFGDAVEQGLLADYKVLVLAVDEKAVSAQFQSQLADVNNELNLDDAAKLVGCWNGLAKRHVDRGRLHVSGAPMRRAVAFAANIKASKKVAALFPEVTAKLVADADAAAEAGDVPALSVECDHVDGTFNVLERNRRLDWLRAAQPQGSNVCRVLSNARCLSEGVDVPALDAVLFLNPRNSVVDVVQSVGRVMRRAPGKEYGYVILPIGIPADASPEQALADNKKYRVVWQVLQALRAHDDRFNAMVNKIELNRARDDKLQVIGVSGYGEQDRTESGPSYHQGQLALTWSDEWRDAIYARIVAKVGERTYWEDWAKDIAEIADRHVTRIKALLDDPNLDITVLFDRFLAGLRANLNDGITRDNAVEMLAQHIITKPVFDALFEGYDFTAHNPVSLVMQDMLDALDEQGIEKEADTLEQFYASVRMRASGIDNAEGKQQIITQLYEKFFRNAFPKAAESLGIVYTPVQIVDFILRSVEHLLRSEFGASLNDEGVHVLDPFTGTGTFIVRLLQSELISADNLLRKYTRELHANEINLLAYYVAAVNIEATFHGLHDPDSATYTPFDGIVLTDTFQMHEEDDTLDAAIFVNNNERVLRQLDIDIRVIVGNPPYSAGQTSANDDNANLKYPTLDARIEQTYAARSTATLKNSLYDSYIRAIRWASDRIGDQGIVGFVSNGGYIDSNTADGLRNCLAGEFDVIYVYNLRGNQRTAGEQSRKEGGKVFGAGSRATIAILFLVKKGARVVQSDSAVLHYSDVGDYLTREQKLHLVEQARLEALDWRVIKPNEYGDWVHQRRDDFERFAPIEGARGIFLTGGAGLKTNRDAWVFNFGKKALKHAMQMISASFASALQGDRTNDPTLVKWSSGLERHLSRGTALPFRADLIRSSTYRPFQKMWVCQDPAWIDRPGAMSQIFPSGGTNLGIVVPLPGSMAPPFLALLIDASADAGAAGIGGVRVFARWRFQSEEDARGFDFEGDGELVDEHRYRRLDNITDAALSDFRASYGPAVTKDDIFYYVYGVLHSPAYRSEFAADLKKMLPRIPKMRDFPGFADAGRRLAELHLGYESVAPHSLEETDTTPVGVDDYERYRVQKMAFGKGKDRSRIIYNANIMLAGIPDEAYRYQLGSRSAVEWIMDRYQIRTDKASGIVNDPNDWSREHEQPRYIIDLLKRIVTVSVETMKIVDSLPPLEIIEEPVGAARGETS